MSAVVFLDYLDSFHFKHCNMKGLITQSSDVLVAGALIDSFKNIGLVSSPY